MHDTRAICDASGTARFIERNPAMLFTATASASKPPTTSCAATAAPTWVASLTDPSGSYAIVNIRNLNEQAMFTANPLPVSYDHETQADRITRRKGNWTPAEVVMA